jgi:hypothetical protein
MPLKQSRGSPSQEGRSASPRRFRLLIAASCAVLAILTASAQTAQPPQSTGNPAVLPNAESKPDASAQAMVTEPQLKPQNFAQQKMQQQNLDTANAERKRQLADESAMLLKLTADLKAEVDKTTKDTLSLDVIRKANEIERLARSVKNGTKITMQAN